MSGDAGGMVEKHPHGGRVRSVYAEWVGRQGIPVVDGHYVADLGALPLGDWAEMGGRGCLVHHEATEKSNNCYVCEVPAGGQLRPQQHVFELMIYVLRGRGATTVWPEGAPPQTFEWQEGSLFAIPLNVRYQHFNGSGAEAARFLAVTTAPLVMNLFEDLDFVFDNPFVFRQRFSPVPDAFSGAGQQRGMVWETNFVPDVRRFDLLEYRERGAGGRQIKFQLAGNTMQAHVSEFPVGTYKKAHRHGPGAHVVVLSGEGYSLMWPEGTEPQRCDWRPGTLVIPPDQWFHQHFNSGATPARYLALKYAGSRRGVRNGVPLSSVSVREGGDQLDYQDQPPDVRSTYERELARRGLALRM